jgi:hypothetical protein
MEVLKRADIPQVELRTERVTVESLGGDLIVRARDLPLTLRLASLRARLVKPEEGETADDAQTRAGAEYAAQVLAKQVVDADGEAVMTAAQWSIWGGTRYGEFIRLYEKAEELSGGDREAVAKN